MKDIILARNKLRDDAMQLRTLKFDNKIKSKHSTELNKEQDKLWKRYVFFDKFIKAKGKEKNKNEI